MHASICMSEPFTDIPKALADKYTVEKEGRRSLMLRYAPSDLEIGGVIKDIQKAKLTIADISTKESDLEDVFLQLTSK
jgi:ABC-2 type transport system ATP-binding protein